MSISTIDLPSKTPAEDRAIRRNADGRNLADDFLKAVESGKLEQVNELFDWSTLLDRATAGIHARPELRTQFIETGKNQAASAERSFAAKLLEQVKEGMQLRLLRIHEVSQQPRILFRLVRKDGNIGYLDLLLAKDGKGRLRIVDVDAAQDGQLLSTTIRESYLQMLATQQPKLVESLSGDDRAFFLAAKELTNIATLRQADNFRQAMEFFERLPADVRSRKTFQRLHVAIAHGVGDEAYTAALDEFRKRFPDDTCQNLLSADEYLRTKQFEKAAGCIRVLDRHVDDPYLDVLLTRLYLQVGDPVAARAAADAAIRRAPRELDGYEARLSVSLAEKNFDDTARLLHFIGTRFGAEFKDLKKLPAYAEFVKSPAYEQWQKFKASQANK